MLFNFIKSHLTPCYYNENFLKIIKGYKYCTYIIKLFNKINLKAFFNNNSVKRQEILLKLEEKQFKDKKTGKIYIFYKVLYDGKIFWVYSLNIKEIY